MMELGDTIELSQIGEKEFEEIRHAFTLRKCGQNEILIHEGDRADNFYFVKTGQMLVSRKNKKGDDDPLAVLRQGQFFGEIALLENIFRTATVMALVDSELFELSKEKFNRALKHSVPFSSLLKRISRNRLLKNTTVFRELDQDSLFSIQKLIVEKSYPENTVIFKENDSPDALYIVLKGGVRVLKQMKNGKEMTLDYLGQNDFFGEMGLIEAQPRSATVITIEPSELLMLPRQDFHSLLIQNPRIAFNMMKVLSQRLREHNKEMASVKVTPLFKGMTIVSRPGRCLSCRACEIACAVSKSRSQNLDEAIFEQPPPVKRIHVRKTLVGSEPVIRPEHCTHCRDAPCLTSCKQDAIKKDVASRTIVLLEEKCTGCGLCVRACPFNVITLTIAEGKKRVALKCNYCAEHQDGPACVRCCPTNALVISLATVPGSDNT